MDEKAIFIPESSRVLCNQCQTKQPKDWNIGNLCIECGGVVRQESRCAWCTKWTPAGRYCRECGSELMAFQYYGAARMLKRAGVDQFSLPKKIQELEAEQLDHFERLYQKSYAVMLQRIEEVRLCQKYLVQQDHTVTIEEFFMPLLPFNEEQFQRYSGEQLITPEAIYQKTPVALIRALATLACLRSGIFEKSEAEEKILHGAIELLNAPEKALALEAAFALGYWRIQFGSFGKNIDWIHVAEIAKNALDKQKLQLWAAAACWQAMSNKSTLLDKTRLAAYLQQASQSTDEDLRLTAALCLQNELIIASFLASNDESKKNIVAIFLAKAKSVHLLPYLVPHETCLVQKVMYVLKNPLPEKFIPSLLHLLEHENLTIVRQFFRILEPQLTSDIIAEITSKAVLGKNIGLFELLLKSKYTASLPEIGREKIIRASLKIPFGIEIAKLYASISISWSFPSFLIQKFQNAQGEILLLGVKIAEGQIYYFPAPDYRTFLFQTIFSCQDEKIIYEAILAFVRAEKHYSEHFEKVLFNQKNIDSAFGIHDFVLKFAQFLKRDSLLREVGVFEWIADFLGSYDYPLEDLKRKNDGVLLSFFDSLVHIIKTDYWLNLRINSALILAKSAAANSEPEKYALALERYLQENQVLYSLEQAIKETVEKLKKAA